MPIPSVPCIACTDPSLRCILHPTNTLPPLNPFYNPPRFIQTQYLNPGAFSVPLHQSSNILYPHDRQQQQYSHEGSTSSTTGLFSTNHSGVGAIGATAVPNGAQTSTGYQGFLEQPPHSPSAKRSNRSAGVKRKNGPKVMGRQQKIPKHTKAATSMTAGIGPSIQHEPVNTHPRTEQSTLPSSAVPPSYVVRDPTSSKTSQDLKDLATGASDCWIHLRGVNEADLPSDPNPIEEAKQDGARRAGGLTAEDLRRPDNKYPRALCLICLCTLGEWKTWVNKDSGIIKGIRNHLTRYHGAAYTTGCQAVGSNHIDAEISGDNSPDNVIGEEITSEGLARYIAELVADQDLAFNIVQATTFRRLLCYVGQGNIQTSNIPERRTIAQVTSDLSKKEKDQLKEDMKQSQGRVSLTSDLWTDVMEHPFMAVTGHFINAIEKSVAALMAFRIVEGAHTGVILAQHIFAVLKEYNIVHKIGSITLDDASNNNTMMEELTRLIRAEGYDFDKEGNRIRCFPHIINLAVTAFLDALNFTGDKYLQDRNDLDRPPTEKTENYILALKRRPDKKCRLTVVALRKGQRRAALRQTIIGGNSKGHFKQKQLRELTGLDGVPVNTIVEVFIKLRVIELLLDVPTRWSSTRDMLDRFAELYPATWEYLNKNKEIFSDLIMSDLEFKELLSAEQTPTLSLAFPVYDQLIHSWRQVGKRLGAFDYAIECGIAKIQEYMAKSRTSPIHIVAMVLNPCLKYIWIDAHWSEEEKKNAREVVKRFMLQYLEARERRSIASSTENLSTQASQAQGRGFNSLFIEPEGCIYDDEFGVTPPQSPAAPPRIQPTPQRPPSNSVALSPYAGSPSRTVALHQKLIVDAEHERYVKEQVLPLSQLGKTDLVKHWTSTDMGDKFSLIYAMAMDVLPAQASSVSSERVFSSSKLTCTRARNRMKANTVESLQILKYALRNRYRNNKKIAPSVVVHDGAGPPNHPEGSEEFVPPLLDLMARLGDVDWGHDAILDEDSVSVS